LRWHLHELDPAWDPPLRTLNRYKRIDEVIARLGEFDGLVARLALEHAHAVRNLIRRVNDLEREIKELVTTLAPTLLALPGCGVLSAAKSMSPTREGVPRASDEARQHANGSHTRLQATTV
jgi:transposase